MMAGTTVSGIGSGIDTQAIVKSLVDAQKAPKQTQINTQTLKATTTLSSIGKIQAALDAFRRPDQHDHRQQLRWPEPEVLG
jgi:flagellar hook-associated protein 2